MLELVPGTSLDHVRSLLVEASRATTQPLNASGPQEAFNDYFLWAANQVRALRGVISPADLDRLVTTRRYWSMLGRSFIDFGPALRFDIEEELLGRRAGFDRELERFDAHRAVWRNGQALALVPDTSVFIEFGYDFPTQPWHTLLGERSNVRILLVITMAAVHELDAKKLSRDNTSHGVSVRNGVHGALRRIEELFPWNTSQTDFHSEEMEIGNHVVTVLLSDDLDHVPLPDADGEMIRQGIKVRPYSGRASLVTYDLAQMFRAREAGLESKRLRYDYEPAEAKED
jgi:hypothetical protein